VKDGEKKWEMETIASPQSMVDVTRKENYTKGWNTPASALSIRTKSKTSLFLKKQKNKDQCVKGVRAVLTKF